MPHRAALTVKLKSRLADCFAIPASPDYPQRSDQQVEYLLLEVERVSGALVEWDSSFSRRACPTHRGNVRLEGRARVWACHLDAEKVKHAFRLLRQFLRGVTVNAVRSTLDLKQEIQVFRRGCFNLQTELIRRTIRTVNDDTAPARRPRTANVGTDQEGELPDVGSRAASPTS